MLKRTKAADRWRLPDEPWGEVQPRLPARPNPHRLGGGRPRTPDRACADAVSFRLRAGCRWKALGAPGICPGPTAHDRFQEWVAAGVFLNLWKAGLLEYDELRGIDWSWPAVGGCLTQAPLGGEAGKNPTDCGKRGAKRSPSAGGNGIPVGVAVGGASRNDFEAARQAIEGTPVGHPRPTEKEPRGACLGKGYDFGGVRARLVEFALTGPIRARGEEARALKRRAGYRARRWVVGRAQSWLNRYRAVPTRWCEKPENFLATWHVALALITYRATGLTG